MAPKTITTRDGKSIRFMSVIEAAVLDTHDFMFVLAQEGSALVAEQDKRVLQAVTHEQLLRKAPGICDLAKQMTLASDGVNFVCELGEVRSALVAILFATEVCGVSMADVTEQLHSQGFAIKGLLKMQLAMRCKVRNTQYTLY